MFKSMKKKFVWVVVLVASDGLVCSFLAAVSVWPGEDTVHSVPGENWLVPPAMVSNVMVIVNRSNSDACE